MLRLELALEEQGAACAELQAANQQLTAEKEQVWDHSMKSDGCQYGYEHSHVKNRGKAASCERWH